MTSAWDVVIVGCGPAGSTLARHLAERTALRVLLLDGRLRRKCCGGMLSAEGQQALREQGLSLPNALRVEPQPFCVRTYDYDNRLQRRYPRPYLNIDREGFDRWLLDLIPQRDGVAVWRGAHLHRIAERGEVAATDASATTGDAVTTDASADDALLRLTVRDGSGVPIQVWTRLLVGADGASSTVRRLLPRDGREPIPYYVAIQQWFRAEKQPTQEFGAIFDRHISDYYCWTVPKGDHLIVGAALEPRGAAYHLRFERLLDHLRAEGYDLSRPVYREGALIRRPSSKAHIDRGDAPVFLIGEAGGWISPSSSEGVSFAIRTGAALADAVIAALPASIETNPAIDPQLVMAIYRRKTRRLERHLLRKCLKSKLMYHPTLRGWIMRSRLLSKNE